MVIEGAKKARVERRVKVGVSERVVGSTLAKEKGWESARMSNGLR